MAIATVFLGALYTTFLRMIQTSNRSQARVEAFRNGRAALMTIFDEVKAINRAGGEFLLLGVNRTLEFGDGIDNDNDGRVDEEILNGRDDDGDWVAARDDLHARIGGEGAFVERFQYTTQGRFGTLYSGPKDDLGDRRVDEDNRFGRDAVVFSVFPPPGPSEILLQTITYAIDAFDGEPAVLVRQARTEFVDPATQPVETVAPLAFGVLGLDILYYDPNGNPNPGAPREDRPYWVERWDSTDFRNFRPPRLPLPASLFVGLTLYADPRPFETYREGTRVETVFICTVINIEDTIDRANYPRPNL